MVTWQYRLSAQKWSDEVISAHDFPQAWNNLRKTAGLRKQES